jgi:translocation and assembly module TamB
MPRRRLIRFVAPALCLGLGLAAVSVPAQEDQGVIAGFVSRVLSTPTSRVVIGDVEGALSSNVTIRNIRVGDANGDYLTIDRVRLVWNRAALIARRLDIETLEVGKVELSRKPAPQAGAEKPADGPILPELPLKVRVAALTLAELALGEPVIGVPARLSASGKASLGPPSEGLDATIELKRLDAAGATGLRLLFTPQGERLDLALQHDEPEGGLAARLMNIPGLPPVKLDLSGTGTLDDWNGRLDFDAGPGIGARGTARLARAAQARRLGLDLKADIEKLLPVGVGAVFSGETTLTGAVTFADDGALGLDRLRLASALAEMTVEGSLDARQTLDVALKARAMPGSGGATRHGAVSLGRLVLDARASGPAARPSLEGRLDLAELDAPEIRVDTLAATFALQPVAGDAARFDLSADARAGGVVPSDRARARALGDTLTLNARARIDDKGVADVQEARLSTPTATIRFAGRAGAAEVDGTLGAEIGRLEAFSGLAGRKLAGRARIAARLTGEPRASRIAAGLDGEATGLLLGDPGLDRLTGGRLALTGTIRNEAEATHFEAVKLAGAFVEAALDGRLAARGSSLGAALSLPDLGKLDSRLAGAARARAGVAGSRTDPDVALELAAPELRALGRPVRDLALKLDGTRLVSAPNLAATLSGRVDGKPLTGRLEASGTPDGAWTLPGLQANLGSVELTGSGRIDAERRATGRLALRAGDLSDLSVLVLAPLSGAASASLVAEATGGRQDLAVAAEARRVRWGEALALDGLSLDLKARDLTGTAAIDGQAGLDRLTTGGQTFERIRINAAGEGGGSRIAFTGRLRGTDLAAGGLLQAGRVNRLRLDSLEARRGSTNLALAGPATLAVEQGRVLIDRLALRANGGELAVKGAAGADLDLEMAAKAFPLAIAELVLPDLGLAGTLDATARLEGPADAPRGPFDLRIRGLSAPQTRQAGLPALEVTARGEARGDRAGLEARIAGGRALSATISGTAPLSAEGALDLALRAEADLGLANAMLAGSGQRVGGRLSADAALRGRASDPRIEGTATLSGGSFADPLQGVALNRIEGRFAGRGDTIVVERLTARAKNGGEIAVSGRVGADPARGFPGDLRITARNAQLVSSDIATLVAGLDLTASGPLATAPRLGGRVDVALLEVRVPDRLPASAEPLRDARHVAPPPQTQARLAQIARQKARAAGRAASPFDATLDLVIAAPARIFVRGRGIDAELGGDLRLAGRLSAPQAIGAFEMRRGRLSILSQRLDFSRGRLTFAGDTIPELDFLAQTQAGEITARVAVTGRADDPSFVLSSSPELPQDEVLSRLLFARAAGGLSPFQAVQLAEAVAQLSGAQTGPGLFEQTRRALGVDDLDVGYGKDGPTVGVSRAISDKVRVGVKAGSKPETSALGADIDLTRRLKVQTEFGLDGRTSVGVATELEY